MKVLYIDSLEKLQFGQLMDVYFEGNTENAALNYPRMDRNAALLQAEQDFYAYLQECFFQTKGAYYSVLTSNGRYVCALRMEPYEDGYLLAALETKPDCRRLGFAGILMQAVLKKQVGIIYSHVAKDNEASLKTHGACGFEIIAQRAKYLDGTENDRCYTLRFVNAG